MYLKPDKPFGPSRNTPHMLFDSLLRRVTRDRTFSQSGGSSNVIRINLALAWKAERPRLARPFQYAGAGRQIEYQGLWEFREKKEDVIETSA